MATRRVTDWGDVTRDHCRAWLAHLVHSGASQDTRRGRHCGVDRFLAWLVLEEEVARNPPEGMPLPSPGQTQVQALTGDQMRKLIKQFGRTDFRDVRDEAIVRLIGRAGDAWHELRRSDLVVLTTDVGDAARRRHRLNRGGDRQLNAALWRVTVVRLRCHPATKSYLERRTEDGKTKPEILRCIKRYLAREVFAALPREALGLT